MKSRDERYEGRRREDEIKKKEEERSARKTIQIKK
jgi:hypothetical protein